MIATLRGNLLFVNDGRAVVETGGVGYDVRLCRRGQQDVTAVEGDEVFLHVHTSVREDAIDLYGFVSMEDKEMFSILIAVSGIGPKVAMNILSSVTPAELAAAVMMDDLARLTKLPGIGKKTAERLCLELKDKVQPFAGRAEAAPPAAPPPAGEGVGEDVVSALTNLGYPQAQARKAVEAVLAALPEGEGPPSIEELLRLTLRSLA